MYTLPVSRLTRPLPLLTGLALLGFALPAAAQMLTVGDSANDPGSATISGAGTMASGAYTFAGGAGPATSSYNAVNVYDPANLTLQTGGSVTNLNMMGGTATVSDGSVGSGDIENGSIFNVQGGSVQSAAALNGSQINVSGGVVSGYISAAFTSTITISGGSVTSATTGNDGQLSITAGTVGDVYNNEGSLQVSGGTLTTVENAANDFGTSASISGGTIQTLKNALGCTTYISGGKFQFINNTSGLVDIFGTNLKATAASGSGDFNALLTGTLTNGDVLDALYQGSGGSDLLEFNNQPALLSAPVPEASSIASLSLMLALGLGGLVVTRRRSCRIFPMSEEEI